MTFPASPTSGQQATEGGRLYQWNGSNAWELVANVAGHAAQHATGGSDAITPESIGAVATSDSRLTDARTPADGSVTTAKITDSAVTDAKIASVAATKVTGTLDDARLSGNVPLLPAMLLKWSQPSTAIDCLVREDITSLNAALTSGTVHFNFFTPLVTVTVSAITMVSHTTVAAGLTLARMGIYTYDETTATLVARTASDTTLFTAASTAYTRSLSTAGGYPATYTLNAGTRYGVAVICTGTTTPQIHGKSGSSGAWTLSPRLSGQRQSQTDLPATTTMQAAGYMPFARLT